jgi:hypothetical protein
VTNGDGDRTAGARSRLGVRRLVRGVAGAGVRIRGTIARSPQLPGPPASSARRTGGGRRNQDHEVAALDRRAKELETAGDLVALHGVLYTLALRQPTDARRAALRKVTGQLLVLTPGWRPRVAGRPGDVSGRSLDVVLCLVDEPPTEPAVDPMHPLRVAANASGMRTIVTAPPAAAAPSPAAARHIRSEIDGVMYDWMELGPGYARITPPDVALEHEAWLAARIVDRVGAGLVHASLGARGPATGLVGLALRTRFNVPLVVQTSADRRVDAVGPHRDAILAVEEAVLPCADVVVTPSEQDRQAILRRESRSHTALEPDRVVVVPSVGRGVDATRAADALVAAYRLARSARTGRGAG